MALSPPSLAHYHCAGSGSLAGGAARVLCTLAIVLLLAAHYDVVPLARGELVPVTYTGYLIDMFCWNLPRHRYIYIRVPPTDGILR
eukprot:854829-Pyramimonas_sp.AAC.1